MLTQSRYLSSVQVIWWLILFTIFLFGVIFAYNAVLEKRGYVDTPAQKGMFGRVPLPLINK